MNDVTITGVIHGGSAAAPDTGSETVMMAFAKVAFDYKPQKADGSLDVAVHFGYDVKHHKTF